MPDRKTVWSGHDLSRLNTIKQVKTIDNYRDHNLCLVLTPISNPFFHCGYIDDKFFAFKATELLQTPQQVLDYYLDKIPEFFHNSELEYVTYSKDYKLFMNSVKIAYETNKPTTNNEA